MTASTLGGMLVAATTGEVVFAVLVPLVSAFIGYLGGTSVARYTRREQLYADAALRIESYIVKATDVLNEVSRKRVGAQGDREEEDEGERGFDPEPFNEVLNLLGLARFHTKRLDSNELDERLSAAQAVATDIVVYEEIGGLFFLKRAIANVMEVVIVFMKLPPAFPPWRWKRTFPRSFFPDREEYRALVKQGSGGNLVYLDLRDWMNKRDQELLRDG